jgi:hypothetical protein
MRRLLLLICVCWIAGATPAAAASGSGLYEPYPAGVGASGAQEYYASLGRTVSPAQLDRGAFIGGLRASSSSGPSGRAGVAAPGAGVWELAAVGACALLAAALALRARWG